MESLSDHLGPESVERPSERLQFDSTQLQVPDSDLFATSLSGTTDVVVEPNTDQMPHAPQGPPGPGSALGDYVLEELIGQGGMGEIYAAVHPVIGKRAAVKLLKKSLCKDPLMVQRFMDEARAVNQIGHPNIVDVFAFGETNDGRSYFVMEWLKGESLREMLLRGPLDVREACRITYQLARALEAAHEKGVIHRDLKPDNVVLVEVRGEPPRVKLLDFGVAKLADAAVRLEQTAKGDLVGTPHYMAPEQVLAEDIDARADIYALGCLAFELITGHPPFVANNNTDILALQVSVPPPRLKLRAAVPNELDNLVARMLAKHAGDRPSLAEIEAVLERIEAGGKTHGVTTPMTVPVRKPSRRRKPRRQPTLLDRAPRWSISAVVAILMITAATLAFILVRELLG